MLKEIRCKVVKEVGRSRIAQLPLARSGEARSGLPRLNKHRGIKADKTRPLDNLREILFTRYRAHCLANFTGRQAPGLGEGGRGDKRMMWKGKLFGEYSVLFRALFFLLSWQKGAKSFRHSLLFQFFLLYWSLSPGSGRDGSESYLLIEQSLSGSVVISYWT